MNVIYGKKSKLDTYVDFHVLLNNWNDGQFCEYPKKQLLYCNTGKEKYFKPSMFKSEVYLTLILKNKGKPINLL